MSEAYDLFRKSEEGERVWLETVIGLDNLKKRLIELSSLQPGTYMVLDRKDRRIVASFTRIAQNAKAVLPAAEKAINPAVKPAL